MIAMLNAPVAAQGRKRAISLIEHFERRTEEGRRIHLEFSLAICQERFSSGEFLRIDVEPLWRSSDDGHALSDIVDISSESFDGIR